jgi:hypothetical protein
MCKLKRKIELKVRREFVIEKVIEKAALSEKKLICNIPGVTDERAKEEGNRRNCIKKKRSEVSHSRWVMMTRLPVTNESEAEA